MTTLFIMPIRSGKTKDYKAFVQECLTSKRAEYKDLLERYALNSTDMWIDTIDGKDYAIFTHDMEEDAPKRLENWTYSTHPFDIWFREQLNNCYDDKAVKNMATQPKFFGKIDCKIAD